MGHPKGKVLRETMAFFRGWLGLTTEVFAQQFPDENFEVEFTRDGDLVRETQRDRLIFHGDSP